MKFLDLFEPITKGDFGLTEEAVYKSIELGNKMIPLWGGNQEHVRADRFVDEKAKTKYNKPIRVFDGEGVIISLDGSAGNMTYKKDERFALNHHAGFFKVRENSDLIDPEFFSIFYQQQFREASISEGSKTLTLDAIKAMDFDIPSRPLQQDLMTQMRPILDRRDNLHRLLERISLFKSKTLSVEYKTFQARDISVIDVFDCMGGNSGLTEREIYQKVYLSGDKYKVLSGSTSDDRELGKVPIFFLNGKRIKTFQDKEGILVIRKGKAGATKFLPPNKYTLTDDAYILFLKADCKYEILLKWFIIQYSNVFMDYASSSDNGTWNMTGFFENVTLDIPDGAEQRAIIDKYIKLEALESRLMKIDTKVSSLFSRIFTDVQ